MLTVWDWAVIALFIVTSLFIGFSFAKRAGKGLESYFLSGRSVPWWLAGISIAASHFSASFPIKVTDLVRREGVNGNWVHWYHVCGIVIGALFFAGLWRRAGIITDNELQELRYSGAGAKTLRVFHVVWSGLIMNAFWLGMSLIAMEKISGVIFPNFKPENVIIIACVIALIYTIFSGLYGVIATDLFQFLLATTGSVMIVIIVLAKLGWPGDVETRIAEGVANISANVESGQSIGNSATTNFIGDPSEFTAITPSLKDNWKVISFILFLTILPLMGGAQGGYQVQRVMATKNERHAMLSLLTLSYLQNGVILVLWTIIGLGSLVLLPNLVDGQTAYPLMGITFLPIVFKGIFVASILAALMSTVDTHLNFAASYIVNDGYKRFINPNAPEKHYVYVSWITMVGVGLFSYLMWLFIMRGGNILDNFRKVMIFFGGAGLVGALKWYWWRVNAWAEIAAIMSSGLITFFLGTKYPEFTKEYYAIGLVVTAFGAAIVWLTVILLTKPTEKERLVRFYERIQPPGPGWGPIRKIANTLPRDGFTKYDLVAWACAIASIYCFTFGMLKLLLGHLLFAAILLVLAFITGVIMVRALSTKHSWKNEEV
ncbi:sodium:solute symporter family protein [Candidatus Hydrogenedentota bacterium]